MRMLLWMTWKHLVSRLLTVVVASRGLLTLGVLKHYVKVRQVKEAEHLKV